MSHFALIPAGVFLGAILLPQFLRWIVLLKTSIEPQGGVFLGPPKRRLLWFVPFAFFFHPAPYLMAGIVAVSALSLLGRLPTWWVWLLTGFYAYAALIALFVVPKLLVLRKKRIDARKA